MPALTVAKLDQTLAEVVDRLAKALSPAAIYLFGSHAYGTPGPNSDIDLLVIVGQTDLSPYARDAVAYRALGSIPVPIDVQVYTLAEFEKRASLAISFERTVRDKGKLIYAA